MLSAMKANGLEIKPNTFRNWVVDWNFEKLAQNKVSMEYMSEIILDDKPTGKYITTRGDVLNKNLTIKKVPTHKNDFTIHIDGVNEILNRGQLVFVKFIDRDVDFDDIYYINGRFEDCDIGNLDYKSNM